MEIQWLETNNPTYLYMKTWTPTEKFMAGIFWYLLEVPFYE